MFDFLSYSRTAIYVQNQKPKFFFIARKKTFGTSKTGYYFQFKDTHIAYYKTMADAQGPPVQKYNLKGN